MINSDSDVKKIVLSKMKGVSTSKEELEILEIINKLLDSYSFVDNQTYPRPSHPNKDKQKDAYFTLIAILLSLRTTLENEQRAVSNFCERYSNINEVVNCDKNELIQLIKCAGMPNKKAETIINVSNYILSNYDGDINLINNGNIEYTRSELFKIPGLGEKSVDCMLELAFDKPSIVVDTNVFRVISRLYFENEKLSFQKKEDILKIKSFIDDNIEKDYRLYQIIHTILLLHGKYICKAIPNCQNCVICEKCKYYNANPISGQLRLF